ncbi:serine/arginine repetitive matrix protein 2-like [Heracleum sosnowskyi]|uniref:Serine/arginine repetitive matrix protein 2-like n=1 Tax=Heracleum sosnowskyi TaxID=360622 RepID=A0AAD8H8X0_9APIA|nr:serine/arginine repetitive matrix protein 2-like [Heracleum sosnowskyi]
MGSCFSKKSVASSPITLPDPPIQIQQEKKKPQEESFKKEIFIIKHRMSHETDRDTSHSEENKNVGISPSVSDNVNNVVMSTPLRTSSCTKEEVDAILIQCGRLSRSSTGKAGVSSEGSGIQRGRKYSGSKRSFDFDVEGDRTRGNDIVGDGDGEEEAIADRIHRHRQRHRDGSSSPHGRRRRTLSRERGGGNGERRVSRSPGRRSESPVTNSKNVSGNGGGGSTNGRPGKLVSVPATVSTDKVKNGGGVVEGTNSAAGVKRVQVKRTVASPRARSPARTNGKASSNEVQVSLSRSNSRKNEQSPYRRNPLSEIDNNVSNQKPSGVAQGNEGKVYTNRGTKEQQKQQLEEAKGMTGNVAVNLISSGNEGLKPQTLTKSRSSRLSRDLDINPETLLNSNPSYTSMLLEDIQNFHQKTAPTPTPAPAFSLPACVTKARSILDAVADLNSGTSSNTSGAYVEERTRAPTADKFKRHERSSSLGANIVESKVVVSNDLMEPSLHKYVTITRGVPREGDDLEEQESSGSNSFVGSQHHWLSSSTWEPNSADSTDCYTSSRTYGRDADLSPLGLQKHELSDEPRTRVSETKRTFDNQRTGIGRGRLGGSAKGLPSLPSTAAAST